MILHDDVIAKMISPADALRVIEGAFRGPPAAGHRAVAECTQDGGQRTLLAMPAIRPGGISITKLVSVVRGGGSRLVSYLAVMDNDGRVVALLEAHALTALRTAAASVLAAQTLGRTHGRLLIMGTGRQAQAQARAFCDAMAIEEIRIWGRRSEAAAQLAAELGDLGLPVRVVSSSDDAIAWADIITCATASSEPIVAGSLVNLRAHVDLVGSFRPDMREADEALMRRGFIVADTPAALSESGDLAQPLASGVIQEQDITFLADLLERKVGGRGAELTVFKSVGHAAEDLVLAELVLERLGVRTGIGGAQARPEDCCN